MTVPIITKSPANGKPCPRPRRRKRPTTPGRTQLRAESPRRGTPFAKMPAAKQEAIRKMLDRIKSAYYGGGL